MKHKLLLFILSLCSLASFAQSADKIAIRKERNSLEISTGLEASLNSLNSAWIETSGGDNTISMSASLFLKHKYEKGKFLLESSLTAKYGYYKIDVERTNLDDGSTYEEGVWYKNQDEFEISISPSFKISDKWSYGGALGFRSQFANGYVSSASQERINLKSGFLAPAYLNASIGINYQCPSEKFPVKISLSPLAMSGTIVASDEIRSNAGYGFDSSTTDWTYSDVYGVSPYKSSKFEGGSAVQIDFDQSFGKSDTFRYITTLYSFYGWISNVASTNRYGDYTEYEEASAEWNDGGCIGDQPTFILKPTARWVNRVEIKATKYLYTNVDFELLYDRAQNANMQTKTILSLGVSYKFLNK